MSNTPPQMPQTPGNIDYDNLDSILQGVREASSFEELNEIVRQVYDRGNFSKDVIRFAIEIFIRFRFLVDDYQEWKRKTPQYVNSTLGGIVISFIRVVSSHPSNTLFMIQGLSIHELSHAFNDMSTALSLLYLAREDEIADFTNKLKIHLATSQKLLEALNTGIDMGSTPTIFLGDLVASLQTKDADLVLQGNSLTLDLEEFLIIRTLIYNAITAALGKEGRFQIITSARLEQYESVPMRVIEITDNVSPSWATDSKENKDNGYALGSQTSDPYPDSSGGLIMVAYRLAQKGGTIELIDNEPEGFKKIRIRLPL